VIGNGTGDWDIPVGGMGALTDALASAARAAGAELRTGVEVVAADADGPDDAVRVLTADDERLTAEHLLSGAAPAVLARLLGDPPPQPLPEGSQLKLNMVLTRLPRLRDTSIAPEDAFAGTFHINESYTQLSAAYAEAAGGQIPSVVPAEAYCHSLTDPSILSPELVAAGAQTLTVFALHMPARLFTAPGAKQAAVEATLRSLNSVLAEPIEDCLMLDSDGRQCLEARTPLELESELGLPGGNIFHQALRSPRRPGRSAAGASRRSGATCGSAAPAPVAAVASAASPATTPRWQCWKPGTDTHTHVLSASVSWLSGSRPGPRNRAKRLRSLGSMSPAGFIAPSAPRSARGLPSPG
jgi:phytoene dehydrogenase-like protein